MAAASFSGVAGHPVALSAASTTMPAIQPSAICCGGYWTFAFLAASAISLWIGSWSWNSALAPMT